MSYEELGLADRLPVGVKKHDETFHIAIRDRRDFTMHSSTIFTYGMEFIGDIRSERDDAILFKHTDYIIQVTSENLFTPSRRNMDGKSYCF